MFFSLKSNNLNWEIQTNNLASFKRSDGVHKKKFYIMVVHWKIQILRKFSRKSIICREELPEKGLKKCADLRAAWQKKELVSLRGIDIPMHAIRNNEKLKK